MKTVLQVLTCCAMFISQTTFSQTYPSVLRNVSPGVSAPGDAFSPSLSGTAVSEAPQAAEWTRTAGPDESIVLTGHQLSRFSGTEEGKDTRFLVYGSGGVKKEARLQRLDGEKAIITLDASLPSWSMYLVWPGNDAGWGAPMAVNKTDAWWLGPDKTKRGATISVFGRNLAHGNVEGTSNSHVYIKSLSGSASQWASVTKVNPYRVDFTVPSSLSNGEYEVWMHNGHGGDYGWSGPLKFSVWDGANWTSNTINVKDYGARGDGATDDATAVKRAIEEAKNSPGSTLFFPAGTYMISTLLDAYSNTRWVGEGRDRTILKCTPNFSSPYAFIFGNPTNFELNDLTIDANKSFRGGTGQPVFLRGSTDLWINNVRLSCQNYDPIDLHNTTRAFINNSEIIGKGSFLGSAIQLFIDRCAFKLTNDTDMGLYAWGVNGLSITNTTCQDLDGSNLSNLANLGKGRFLTSAGNWGSNRNTYLGYNTTTDLSPSPFSADLNSGEQFMWEGNTPSWRGNASSATATSVTLNGYNINEPNKAHLVIVKGKGLGQSRRVISNNGGTVTINEPWNVIPDGNSVVTVGPFVDRVAVYKNFLDAKAGAATQNEHVAAAGIEPYGGALNFIADNNTLHELRYGSANWTQQWDDLPWAPNYFTMYTNNKYIGCRVAIQNASDARNPYGAAIFGTMYRKNTIQNAVQAAIENAVNLKDYPMLSTMVYEHNSCTGLREAFFLFAFSTYQHEQVLAAGGMDHQLLYKNSFQGTGVAMMGSSKMGLRENTYSGFSSVYTGILPDAVVEAPFHVLELNSPTNGAAIKTNFELWNSGVSALGWNAKSSIAWLTISSNGSIATEKEKSLIEFTANPQGLSAGVHKGYITVTAGSQTKLYTVLLTVGASIQPSAPIVNLTSPTSGSNFTAPATITLTADASDADGTVSKVEFFNGSTKLGEDLTAPYSFSWNGVAEGTYSITAKATDNGGLSTTSQNSDIGVKSSVNLAPAVSLTSPTNGSNFAAPATVTLTADASDADGTVSKVEFFNGSTKLGEDLTAPYSFSWSGVAEGTYNITAKATDNGGLSTTSQSITIAGTTTSVANLAPAVSLTSPTNGSNFAAPATITLTADASDADGTVSKVEFFNGITKLGEDLTAPYSFSWSGVAEGTYSITAKATDNGGLSTTSQSITIAATTASVANLAPAVSLTSPTNGSNFAAPATITLTADASDADGTVSKVEFFNGSTKLGEDLTAPYSFSWNGATPGNYFVTAKATDNGGLSTTSQKVHVKIRGGVNIAPVVNLTSPTNGSNFTTPANITLAADASDADGTVSKVEFFNGSIKIGEDLTAPYNYTWNNVTEGTYRITAKAIDNDGLSTTSQFIDIVVSMNIANIAPLVNLTSPTNGSNFTAPATIILTADASDADGTITKVEFFNGRTKLGEDLTAPYSFSWSGVAEGSYSITAKATDNGGLTTTTQNINIAVTTSMANLAPVVNITSPSNGSNFTAPATITLTADASDVDGTVSKVEFFNGATKLGEDLTAPYNFTWNGITEGTYTITAKVTDNGGLSTISQNIEILINGSINLAPAVNLTSPTNGSNFTAPATITLTANASDADGTISKVEFFDGSTKLGEDFTAPYSFTWNGVGEGSYTITAKATDNGGLSSTSQNVDITLKSSINLAPAVNLTSPSNGSNFTAPATITLTADASDADGTVSKVEFFNGSTKLGEDVMAPYSFTWSGVAEGGYSITAKATDNSGLSSTSQNVDITLKSSVNLAPTVNLTSPTNGSNFTAPAIITITADASDADGTVSKVEFFDGSNKLGEDLTAPYSFSWSGVASGNYSITAKATDNAGLSTVSQTITIAASTNAANLAPVVNLTSPSNGSNFTAPATITLTADASDADGTISKVEFFDGGTKLGEDLTAPYSFSWSGVASGNYSVTAKATDNAGLSTVSQTITIAASTNAANLAPVVNLTSPSNGSNFTAPATITLTADASDADGTISKVEFFNGSTKLGEDVTAPYSYAWDNVTEGTYSITAKATDNGGLSTASYSIYIVVKNSVNLAPVVNLTSPSNGSNFTAPATITLTADASDADGTISKVEFFNGSTKLGEAVTAPYSYAWDNVTEGTYSITAKATDNGGLSTASYSIYIVVKNSVNLAPVVNLTSPNNGSNFTAPATITLMADASDADGTISKVEFFNGSTKLGEDVTAPYSYAWDNVTEGTYSITAKATDNSGLTASYSTTIAVTIPMPHVPPAVSLVSLTRGGFVAPSNIILTAEASDADGSINKVEFFANGVKLAETATYPYSISWNNVEAGVYLITAKATDNNGLTTFSAEMEVVVTKPQIAPNVRLTSPINNTSFAGPVNIAISAEATAVDASIVKVEFFNGNIKLGEDATSPFEFVWTNVPVGSYQITARATDSNGLSDTSEIITATVVENKNQLKVYPNPFSTVTTVEFSLTTKAYVELQVFNSMGVLVTTPFKGIVEGPVVKRVSFNGSGLPQGTYFCRLIYNDGLSYFKKWLETKIVIMR